MAILDLLILTLIGVVLINIFFLNPHCMVELEVKYVENDCLPVQRIIF